MVWDIPRTYSNLVIRATKLRAMWPPVDPVRPGDYGELRGGVFFHFGNLADDYGIEKPKVGPGGSFDLSVTSKKVRVTQFQAGVKVNDLTRLTSGKVKLEIAFQAEHAVFARANGCTSVQIKNAVPYAKRIAREIDEWKHRRWLLVRKVWTAPACLILASKASSSTVTLEGSVKAIQGVFDGKVGAGVRTTGMRSMGLDVRGKKGPVLIATSRIKRNGTLA